MRGVGRQMEAFKEGFNSVFLLSSLQGLIYPGEVRGGHGGGRREGRGWGERDVEEEEGEMEREESEASNGLRVSY